MNGVRWLCCWLLLIGTIAMTGCEQNSGAIVLSQDELERLERKAIDYLRNEGCKLEETEDEIINARGIMVRIFPEHLTETGTIRSELVREIRDLRKCFLILDGTPISPAGLAELKSLGNVLLLSAQQTPINDDGLRQIEGIVSLRLLRLNWTRVSDDSLRHINRLPELKMLYLSGTKVTDRGLDHLVILKKLQALQLAETKLTDRGARHLSEFPELMFLSLRGTDISDDTVAVLSKLKKLKHVDITDTHITLEGLKSLQDALPDCNVRRELTFRSPPEIGPAIGPLPAPKP